MSGCVLVVCGVVDLLILCDLCNFVTHDLCIFGAQLSRKDAKQDELRGQHASRGPQQVTRPCIACSVPGSGRGGLHYVIFSTNCMCCNATIS